MSAPAISVAMSVYNSERFLAPAIESILSQSFQDFEFLILNDGSTDGSAAIIDGYAARDSRIRPIHRENRGLVASLNQMIAEARAPIIARMDGDDLSRPERFARQLAFLNANPDHGVIGCWTADMDEEGNPIQLTGDDQPVDHQGFLRNIPDGPLLCHPATMIRTSVLQQVGGYHAAFRHCEDYDLWLRLSHVTRLCSLPERLLVYRHSGDQVSRVHRVEQALNSNIAWFAWRERAAGRPDPTASLTVMPPVEELDTLFGRDGVAREIVSRTAPGLLHSPVALKSDAGFALVEQVAHDGGHAMQLWRTVMRLGLRMNDWGRAMRLARSIML